MSVLNVLLVAGTHGNEINAPWLFNQWSNNSNLINTSHIEAFRVIGNPEAYVKGKRYLDRDLNRSFRTDLFTYSGSGDKEISRAKELVSIYGSVGRNPCQIAIDFHSTTSSMGNSLVIYGRRPADLALAALIQFRLGLPIYLHEGDSSQTGFLVESWPCGLVVEIGPVPQSVLDARVIEKTRLTLEITMDLLREVLSNSISYPNNLVVHRHLESLDYPRDNNGVLKAFLHKTCQGHDWKPLEYGTPIFLLSDGEIIRFEREDRPVPVFINEAAYAEKNIAMSLTKREVWNFQEDWKEELEKIIIS